MKKLPLTIGSLMVILNGCGGGSTDNTPNTDPINNTQTPPPATTSSPPSSVSTLQMVSTVPAANEKGVSFNAPIKLVFNENLDAASVNNKNVSVVPSVNQMSQGGMRSSMNLEAITGEVTYDANTKTALFKPTVLMQHGVEYIVQIKNIRSATGQLLPDTSFAFRTLMNPVIRAVHYDLQNGGQLKEVYKYNANNEIERIDYFASTEVDDVLVSYELRAGAKLPDPPNVPVQSIIFSASDNLVQHYSVHIKQGDKMIARATYVESGADGLWNQTDDLISRYTLHPVQHLNHTVTQHFGAIDDIPGLWSDIEAERATRFQFTHASVESVDNAKRLVLDANYKSLGSDNVVDTNAAGDLAPINDVLNSYSRIEYNAQGQRVKIWDIGGHSMNDMAPGTGGGTGVLPGAGSDTPNFGADSTWFTPDDPITGLTIFEYSADGIPSGMTSYESPGADNNWDTLADNDVAEYMIMTHKPDTASMTKMERFSSGVDKRVGNDDELLLERFYDPNL